MSAAPEPTRRLVVDARGERLATRARALAGALALGAGIWLFALPHPTAWPFALAGIIFGALWIRRSLTQPRGERDALILGPEACVIQEQDRAVEIAWQDVTAIEVDEDRLTVRIDRTREAPLHIEPRYGQNVYALRDLLHTAWHAAPARTSTQT